VIGRSASFSAGTGFPNPPVPGFDVIDPRHHAYAVAEPSLRYAATHTSRTLQLTARRFSYATGERAGMKLIPAASPPRPDWRRLEFKRYRRNRLADRS
jgi:hypothetical protein